MVIDKKCLHCDGNMAVWEYRDGAEWREELVCLMCGRTDYAGNKQYQ